MTADTEIEVQKRPESVGTVDPNCLGKTAFFLRLHYTMK